jgi:hypothetical protein
MPKMYGGTSRLDNIVRCAAARCAIRSRALVCMNGLCRFRQFLELHGEDYRVANPDDWATIGAMTRKFNQWLPDSQHAKPLPNSSLK